LNEAKGVQILYDIDMELKSRNIFVTWTIIGNGPLKEELDCQWRDSENVKFLSPNNNKDVLRELIKNDLFVLPTQFEGYGIAILEALACGAVPIVADVAGGTREILKDFGYRVEVRNINAYCNVIEMFYKDRTRLRTEQIVLYAICETKL